MLSIKFLLKIIALSRKYFEVILSKNLELLKSIWNENFYQIKLQK